MKLCSDTVKTYDAYYVSFSKIAKNEETIHPLKTVIHIVFYESKVFLTDEKNKKLNRKRK